MPDFFAREAKGTSGGGGDAPGKGSAATTKGAAASGVRSAGSAGGMTVKGKDAPGVRSAGGAGGATTSIGRSIARSFWLRRLGSFVTFDVILLVTMIAVFLWQCTGSFPPEQVEPFWRSFPWALQLLWEPYDLNTLGVSVTLPDGETLGFLLCEVNPALLPIAAVVVVWQVLGLLTLGEDTRRVRRKLGPLQDLAMAAESLGSVAREADLDTGKLRNLQEAISRASVDQPQVATGDSDLRSIEVALNGLLRQMQEAKLQQMRFVSDASHELRTPIAVIQGYVQMLDRWGKSDPEVLEESIAALRQESGHMQELVEQLLFLARGDSGRQNLQMADMDLAEVVRQVTDESRMIDSGHTYALDSSAAQGPLWMTGDDALVKQVARVLVQNAAKYSPAGSDIRLATVRGEDGRVGFSVQDQGVGMGAEDIGHIFERFYRSDAARSGEVGGTGLGLSIADWIVNAHGGSIEVVSSEGIGTRFTVMFPATSPAATSAPAPTSGSQAPASWPGPTSASGPTPSSTSA